MKRIHYLLLGLALSLCLAAVAPTTPPTRLVASTGITIVTNGVNNFTLSASGGGGLVMNQNQFDSSSTNIKSGVTITNAQNYGVTNFSATFISGEYPNRLSFGAGTALSGNSTHLYQNGGSFSLDNFGGQINLAPNGVNVVEVRVGDVRLPASTLGWSSVANAAADIKLKRDSANVLELNTGTAGLATRATLLAAVVKGRAGTSTNTFNTGGTLAVDTTQTGNVGAGEDTLQTYSVPANTLASNGDYIAFRLAGTFATTANNKRLRVKYGGTTIYDSTALAIVATSSWVVSGTVTRTGAATQKCELVLNSSSSTLPATAAYVTAAEALNGPVTFVVTGEATTDNDIVKETFSLQFQPAP